MNFNQKNLEAEDFSRMVTELSGVGIGLSDAAQFNTNLALLSQTYPTTFGSSW
jgi:hypothetical protein